MRKNNLKNSKKPLTSAEKYDIILKSLKTMKSYHILKTAGDYAKQFAEIVNPAEERLLYIINVCPFLPFEGKVFLFMNG